MIPAARRATPGSLPVVRNVQGRQVARNTVGARTISGGKNIVVAQHERERPQHARGFSRTIPGRSSLNFVLQPKEKGEILKREGRNEDPLGQPEHAVISAFDLFSIGGSHSSLSYACCTLPTATLFCFSWSEQFAHRRPYAGWQYIHQRFERSGDPGTGACRFVAVKHDQADSLLFQVKTVKIALFVFHIY